MKSYSQPRGEIKSLCTFYGARLAATIFISRVNLWGRFVLSILAILLIHTPSQAQSKADTVSGNKCGKIKALVALNDMKSTHNTYFRGGNLIVSYAINETFFMGLGVEYSYCPFHHDNASDLFDLKLVPVFIDTRLVLRKSGKIVPYTRFSAGISFNTYTNKELETRSDPYTVSERGLYLLTDIGCAFNLHRYFTPIIELGLKGYHMSFNNLDVNPHGLVLTLGLLF